MAKKKQNRSRPSPAAQNWLQLKITLNYIHPPIWRRVLVPDNLTLGDLHRVIQAAMGWSNSHLHLFRIGLLEYGSGMDDEEVGTSAVDEESVLLRHVIRGKGAKFCYEYDFGDGWLHEIRVEKAEPVVPGPRPLCLGGARACPPEDCGGPSGYESLLQVLKKARTRDERQLREWAGDYDPEEFDLAAINKGLGCAR